MSSTTPPTKDSQPDPDGIARLNVNLPRPLYDRFVEACKAHDTTVSEVIRAFVRDYVRELS